MAQVSDHVTFKVNRQGCRVPQGEVSKQRQHDIRAGSHTPTPQGLPKVFWMPLNAHSAGQINHAAQPQKGVDADAQNAVYSRTAFELKHAVGERPEILQVGEEVANTGTNGFRCDLSIRNGNWL